MTRVEANRSFTILHTFASMNRQAWNEMEGRMSVKRHPAHKQVPLAHVALVAGEAFGHHSPSDGALSEKAYSGRVRSALALVLIVCAMAAAYLAM